MINYYYKWWLSTWGCL